MFAHSGDTMGYRLRREVRDALLPKLLTDGERHVLYEIADSANDTTRMAFPGMDELVRATHFKPGSIAACLERMAQKGIELRVAIGKDKLGKSVYACRGHRTTYLIPRLGPVDNDEKGSTTVEPYDEKGSTTVDERVDSHRGKPQPPSTPSPQGFSSEEPSSSARASYRQRIADVAGLQPDDDEINLIIEQIKNAAKGEIRKGLGAYMRSVTDEHILDHARASLASSAEKAKVAAPTVRCPLHVGSNAYACGSCWGAVKAGEDPYERDPDLRPPGWHEIYIWPRADLTPKEA